MTRKRIRAYHLGLLAVPLIALQLGCSDSDGGSRSDAGPDGGGQVKTAMIGTTVQISSLDPAEAYQTNTYELLLNINSPLYRYDVTIGDYLPVLAADEPVITDGGTTWTIPLREGLTFADGSPFNAEAVKYSIDRAMALGGSPAFLVSSWVESVTVVDDYTVQFKLKQAIGFFRTLLAGATFSPVNKAQYPETKLLNTPFTEVAQDAETWGEKFVDQNSKDPTKLLGLGPYRLETVEFDLEKGDYGAYTQITLRANPAFSPAPKAERVIIKYYDDSAQLEQALRSGAVDVAWSDLSGSSLAALASESGYNLIESNGVITEFLNLNRRVAPFNDATVRQAMAYAIDRAKLQQQVFALTGKALYSMVPQGLWSHRPSFQTLFGTAADLQRTQELLAEAGYNVDNKLSFTLTYNSDYDTNRQMSEIIEADLESTNVIEVTLEPQPESALFARILDRDDDGAPTHTLEMFWMGWSPDYADPDNFVFTFATPAEDLLGCGYDNPAMTTLLNNARAETTLEGRRDLYEDIQDLYATDVVTLPAIQRTKQAVVRSGVTLEPPGIDTLLRFQSIDVP